MFTTGEFRAALQPVRFVMLTKPIEDPDTGVVFDAGTLVSVQYWGAGKVVASRFPDGATVTPTAHNIQGEWAHWGHIADVARATNA